MRQAIIQKTINAAFAMTNRKCRKSALWEIEANNKTIKWVNMNFELVLFHCR